MSCRTLPLVVCPGADKTLSEYYLSMLSSDQTSDIGDLQTGELYLSLDCEGLSLTDGNLSMRGDFSELEPRLLRQNLGREAIVHAARFGGTPGTGMRVLDATAGMGEDSLLLAAYGFDVYLYERNPVIGCLLEDTLRRAAETPDLADITARMHLTVGDSIEGMSCLSGTDVIYLDPMFPERKKSGLIKKKFQLLGQLEEPCADECALMQAAMDARPRKIVVKRPEKAPCLGGVRPSYVIHGSTIRYDCILLSD